MNRIIAVFLGILTLLLAHPALWAQGNDGMRPVGHVITESLVPEIRQREGFNPADSAGVFVGINDFGKDTEGRDRFTPLKYCVDDAIDLAAEFVRLGLIEPRAVRLGLAGTPEKASTRAALEQLKEAGAQVFHPTKNNVVERLDWLLSPNGARKDGILFFTISSHGYYINADAIVCADTVNDLHPHVTIATNDP